MVEKRSYTHNLKKLDYSTKDKLLSTIARVFPELDKEGRERRFEHEKQYIGYTKSIDEITGATLWNKP